MTTLPARDMPRGGGSGFANHAYDHHGTSMFCLAMVVTGRAAEAEMAVVDAISEARGRSSCTRADDHDSLRHELARLTYWRCIRGRGPGTMDYVPSAPTVGFDHRSGALATESLRTLPVQERAAIALCLYGEHTYQEAADLVALPPTTVAGLLSVGLRRLAPALH